MVIFLIIYFTAMVLTGIIAWRTHQSWLQALVTILSCIGLFPLNYTIFRPVADFSSDAPITVWQFIAVLIYFGIIILTIAACAYIYWHNYIIKSIGCPSITLDEYNHFVVLNPKKWLFGCDGYTVYNKNLDQAFILSIWECMWLRITRVLNTDARRKVMDTQMKVKLAKVVQKDIDKFTEENQQQLEKSLKRIEEMRKTQSDILFAYGTHLQTYKDLPIQQQGDAQDVLKDES